MIVLDVETSGTDPEVHSLISIGAVDWNSDAEFYICGKVWDGAEISDEALAVNGFTREQITNPDYGVPFPSEMLAYFERWVRWLYPEGQVVAAGHNVGSFDMQFLKPMTCWSHRSVDLHSIAFAVMGQSLKADAIYRALGMPEEPKPHNALTGAKWEKSALKKLVQY